MNDSVSPPDSGKEDKGVQNPSIGPERILDQFEHNYATDLLRGLSEVLKHHDCPAPVLESFLTQTRAYLCSEDEAMYVKRAKFLLAQPMAVYLRCELPPCPSISFSWCGKFRRWYRSRLSFCSKNTHLWWSFLQAKRSASPLSEEFVRTTYEQHRCQMAAPDPIDDEAFDLVTAALKPVLEDIRAEIELRLTMEREPWELHDETTTEWHVASSSACWERGRGDGGQAGYLFDRHVGYSYWQHGRFEPTHYILDKMSFIEYGVVNGHRREKFVVEQYRPDTHSFIRGVQIEDESLREDDPRLPCMINGILEPLKVRVISKGPAAPYYLSKPLQRALHDTLRRMPCFRLIGRPVCPTDLMDLAENRISFSRPDHGDFGFVNDNWGVVDEDVWNSVDYRAATDGLSARLSGFVLKYLTFETSAMDNQVERWRSTLAPHLCHYPPSSDIAPVRQMNGQLMGSILSFPILCLCNLGLYLALCPDKMPLAQRLKGVLINGDDMLYAAPRSLWGRHVSLGRRIGLEMSTGKAYQHSVFASVNSTSFHFPLALKERTQSNTPKMISYLNTGLLLGQSKVMRVASVDGVDASECSRISTVNEFLSGCWGGRRGGRPALALSKFISLHKDEMLSESSGRNWFIHESLGGCGIRAPAGFNWFVNSRQAAIAVERLSRAGERVSRGTIGPMPPKFYGRELFTHARTPWSSEEEAEKRTYYRAEPVYVPTTVVRYRQIPVHRLVGDDVILVDLLTSISRETRYVRTSPPEQWRGRWLKKPFLSAGIRAY